MKKQNKTNYYIEKMSELLQTGPKTRLELWNALGGEKVVPKATLSDCMRKMESFGVIHPYKRGEKISLVKEMLEMEPLDASIITEWLLLFTLRQAGKNGMTMRELAEKYYSFFNPSYGMDNYVFSSLSGSEKKKIYNRIRYVLIEKLLPQKLISCNDSCYKASCTAPYLIITNYEKLEEFLKFHSFYWLESSTKDIENRIKTMLWGNDASESRFYTIHGKLNTLNVKQIKCMNQLLSLPYKTNKLCITIENGESFYTLKVSIGVLFYYTETNEFYILGETVEGHSMIRVSSIVKLKMTDETNDIYESDQYLSIYNEMYGVDLDSLYDVRIRFFNKPFIKKQVEQLVLGRENATIEIIKEGREILYTDRIRGLGMLARILRSMNRYCIVEQPPELKQRMIESANRITNTYQDICKEDQDEI